MGPVKGRAWRVLQPSEHTSTTQISACCSIAIDREKEGHSTGAQSQRESDRCSEASWWGSQNPGAIPVLGVREGLQAQEANIPERQRVGPAIDSRPGLDSLQLH